MIIPPFTQAEDSHHQDSLTLVKNITTKNEERLEPFHVSDVEKIPSNIPKDKEKKFLEYKSNVEDSINLTNMLRNNFTACLISADLYNKKSKNVSVVDEESGKLLNIRG